MQNTHSGLAQLSLAHVNPVVLYNRDWRVNGNVQNIWGFGSFVFQTKTSLFKLAQALIAWAFFYQYINPK